MLPWACYVNNQVMLMLICWAVFVVDPRADSAEIEAAECLHDGHNYDDFFEAFFQIYVMLNIRR